MYRIFGETPAKVPTTHARSRVPASQSLQLRWDRPGFSTQRPPSRSPAIGVLAVGPCRLKPAPGAERACGFCAPHQPTGASILVLIRFEVTIMPVVTFVQSATDAHGEQFFIDNVDVGNHHGHFTWSLTEAQFKDQFKSRGVSEQEIEDLVSRVRQPTHRS